MSVSLLVGRGAALPAGVLEGGPGAKAGEGEGRGAAQGWHGDPRPHPELCGKVSGGVWRWGADGSLSGRDSCQCLFCSTTCVYRSAGGRGGIKCIFVESFAHLFTSVCAPVCGCVLSGLKPC